MILQQGSALAFDTIKNSVSRYLLTLSEGSFKKKASKTKVFKRNSQTGLPN